MTSYFVFNLLKKKKERKIRDSKKNKNRKKLQRKNEKYGKIWMERG